MSVFGLPPSHWHCTLDNFDWERARPSSLRQLIEDFQAEVQGGNSPHLILSGNPGIGKSHLSVGIWRWGADAFGTLSTIWLNVPDFCDELKASFDDGGHPFEDYKLARQLVVLDDLFGREYSPWEVSNVLYRLIDVAYRNAAAVVITMNQSADALKRHLTEHEASRVLASATMINMTAADYRRNQ